MLFLKFLGRQSTSPGFWLGSLEYNTAFLACRCGCGWRILAPFLLLLDMQSALEWREPFEGVGVHYERQAAVVCAHFPSTSG